MTPEEARDKIFTNWGEFYADIKETYVALVDASCEEKTFFVDRRMDTFQRLMHFLLHYHVKGAINRLEVMWILRDAIRIMEPPTQKKLVPIADRRRRRFGRIFPPHE